MMSPSLARLRAPSATPRPRLRKGRAGLTRSTSPSPVRSMQRSARVTSPREYARTLSLRHGRSWLAPAGRRPRSDASHARPHETRRPRTSMARRMMSRPRATACSKNRLPNGTLSMGGAIAKAARRRRQLGRPATRAPSTPLSCLLAVLATAARWAATARAALLPPTLASYRELELALIWER